MTDRLQTHIRFPSDAAQLLRKLTDVLREHAEAINERRELGGLLDVVITTPTAGEVLTWDGTNWINDAAGGGGGASWTEAEVDFGSSPVYSATFTVTDAGISAASKVQVLPCGKAATGRTADDWAWDGATFAANPGAGSATCYAVFTPGPIVGKRRIQYSVGA